MSYAIRILERAQADIEDIYNGIHSRSPSGASAWYTALLAILGELTESAANYSTAPEASSLHVDFRQAFFRTRRGRTYRLLFVISGNEARILRVRGPGQRPIRKSNLPPDL